MRYFREVDRQRNETRYYEFKGDWVNRQLEILPDLALLLKRGEQSEASLEEHRFGPASEITPSEFLAKWEWYVSLPHGTTRADHPLVLDVVKNLPGPTAGNITTWSDGFSNWDPRLDSLFAQLDDLCRSAYRPNPKTAPTGPPLLNLAAIYEKDVGELTQRDLLVLVRWIRPWLQDDLNALRFYLPHLARFYWAQRAGADLELTLLLYKHLLSATEYQLLTQITVQRVRETYWAWDCVFALFWCDDLDQLEEPFCVANLPLPEQKYRPDSWKRELWYRLRELVAETDDPLQFLWNGQYDVPKERCFFPRLKDERGPRILQFLRAVGWISRS